MDKQEIEEGNRLIAEFCGSKSVSEVVHDLKYHSSWDWLMPVVEKIESDPINDVVIFKEATQIRVWSGDEETFKWKTLEPDGSSKIAHTYRAVVQFIKWYNSTPKQ